MKALLLAAGLGSRLGAYTKDVPKVLLPINGKPIIDIVIRKLIAIGIERIVINTHYKAILVEQFLKRQDYSEVLSVVREEKLLGTAGTLKSNIEELQGSDFMVLHADNYFQDNLIHLLNFHNSDESDSLMTMATFLTNQPETCGVVEVDKNNTILNFFEKKINPPSNIANAAIYIFKKNAISLIQTLNFNENDISNDLIPKFIGISRAFPLTGEFIDIGTPKNYNIANELAKIIDWK